MVRGVSPALTLRVELGSWLVSSGSAVQYRVVRAGERSTSKKTGPVLVFVIAGQFMFASLGMDRAEVDRRALVMHFDTAIVIELLAIQVSILCFFSLGF